MIHQLPGGLPVYATVTCAAALVGMAFSFTYGRNDGISARRLLVAQLLMAVAALAGAKVFGVVSRSDSFGLVWGSSLNGYRYPGAVLSLGLLVWPISRAVGIRPAQLLDITGVAFGFSMATMRIGCFLTGCCAGTLCNLPWAVTYPARSSLWAAHVRDGLITRDAVAALPVHPLQVYFGICSLLIGLFLVWLFPRRRFGGQIFLTYVLLQGVGKFLLEFLRYRPSPEVQYSALALGLVAGALLWLKLREGATRQEAIQATT